MIRGLFILLAFQLVGEVLSRGFALPVPGPVIGLAGLALGLAIWARGGGALEETDVGRVAPALLGALSLLFVPAGVGVVQYGGLLADNALALGAALVASTLATLMVSVGAFLLVKRWVGADAAGAP